MINATEIYRASPIELDSIYQKLIVQKMKLDKFFSVFLDNTELDETDPNTIDWVVYKEMMKDYGRIDHLLTTTKYHLKHNVQ